jgi:hypothetical protein
VRVLKDIACTAEEWTSLVEDSTVFMADARAAEANPI